MAAVYCCGHRTPTSPSGAELEPLHPPAPSVGLSPPSPSCQPPWWQPWGSSSWVSWIHVPTLGLGITPLPPGRGSGDAPGWLPRGGTLARACWDMGGCRREGTKPCVPPHPAKAATPLSPPRPGQEGQHELGVPDAHVEEVVTGGTAQQVPQGEGMGEELREVAEVLGGAMPGKEGAVLLMPAGPDPQLPRSSVCQVAMGLTVAVVAGSVSCRCSHSRRRGSACPWGDWGLGGERSCPGAKHLEGTSP